MVFKGTQQLWSYLVPGSSSNGSSTRPAGAAHVPVTHHKSRGHVHRMPKTLLVSPRALSPQNRQSPPMTRPLSSPPAQPAVSRDHSAAGPGPGSSGKKPPLHPQPEMSASRPARSPLVPLLGAWSSCRRCRCQALWLPRIQPPSLCPGASLLPPMGQVIARRPPELAGTLDGRFCWDNPEVAAFKVRSREYVRTKVKEPAAAHFFEVQAVDCFRTDRKTPHIASRVRLREEMLDPAGGRLSGFPDWLIMHFMLPSYAPSIFGHHDGPGYSMVYYCKLREDFDPASEPNQAAVGLLRRFLADGREADGSSSRDRLKLIPRVLNLDEMMPLLHSAEYKLAKAYEGKPVMCRPQTQFHQGPNYLEVDLDVHQYNYLARKTLHGFLPRFPPLVFDTAWVLQGNSPDELPEALLVGLRMFRFDFETAPALPSLRTGSLPPSPSASPRIMSHRSIVAKDGGEYLTDTELIL